MTYWTCSLHQANRRKHSQCEDWTRTRSAGPPHGNSIVEKREFAAMKMNVQRRANSKMRVRSVFWFQVPRLGTAPPNLLWLPPEKMSAEAPAFTRKAPPIASPIGSFGIHSLVVCPVLAIQNQHTRKSTKDSKPPRNETDEGERRGRGLQSRNSLTCLYVYYKNRPAHAFTSWRDWGLLGLGAVLSCPPSS